MLRIRGKATAAGAALALAPVLFLTACGHNDSTASSTPTLKTSTTTAALPSATTAAGQPSTEAPAPQAPAPTTTSVVPERPQPAQPTTDAPLAGKDQGFLDELNKRGVHPSSPDIALTTAQYICQSKAAGASDQELSTYVNAMAGSDPSFDAQKMPVEQAGKIYIDVATATYCDK
ncbi:DUF732 domain-containing protein [Nocardia sp. alder85J]|uniref:DUF732 domain-containing protein n=1 Tax=Nocardia sp. alder85J TaxID=2862949 RepID=UPI001CD21E6D|nr:DUF732 domain-containing protein [Nocardia sp. alder85J]MCX4096634.1 DUF732 domain-containing protein [Nocardia sp. alder85J]